MLLPNLFRFDDTEGGELVSVEKHGFAFDRKTVEYMVCRNAAIAAGRETTERERGPP